MFPPAKDPYRARAGAWAGKGGSAWVDLYVGGERTLRLRVSDIDTDSGPRAILKVYSHCAS